MKALSYTISIPEPCHEDWNKMTESEQGRYCGACSKSVIDFSNKTEKEIAEFLQRSQGEKICGRFRNDQLNKPIVYNVNFDKLPGNMSVSGIFAIALLLVFGTGLVSCFDHRRHRIDKIEWKAGETNLPGGDGVSSEKLDQSILTETRIIGDTILTQETDNSSLKIESSSKEQTTQQTPSPIFNCQPIYLSGAVTFTWQPPPFDTGAILKTYGYVVVVVNHQETGPDPFPAPQDDTITREQLEIFEGLRVFPNPTIESFIVNYKLLEKSDVCIDVLDEGGKLIRNLLDVTGQEKGEYQVPGNAADLPRGVYFISRLINGRRDLKKLVITN